MWQKHKTFIVQKYISKIVFKQEGLHMKMDSEMHIQAQHQFHKISHAYRAVRSGNNCHPCCHGIQYPPIEVPQAAGDIEICNAFNTNPNTILYQT